MAKAISDYGVEAGGGGEILQAFINTVEAEKPPPVIYHYTNDAGLAGIIETGRLWFSDIFGLNDPSELRHGLSIGIELLKSRITGARPEVATFASMFLSASTWMPELKRLAISLFAASAPMAMTSASGAPMPTMVRASLGFDTSLLEDVFTKKKPASSNIRPFMSLMTIRS